MKIKILILLFFFLAIKSNAQDMTDLYNQTIDKYVQKGLKEGFIKENDTIYFTFGFDFCQSSCFDVYELKDKNVLSVYVKIGLPQINDTNIHPHVSKLNLPELNNRFIEIKVIPYGYSYHHDGIHLVNGGYSSYFYEFNKKKARFILKKVDKCGI